MSQAIGIDLGTTHSCAAVQQGREVRIIPDFEGARTIPTTARLSKAGELLVGWPARRHAAAHPGDKSEFSAAELSALILRRLKLNAEMFLRGPVTQAVISVPAHFDEERRQTVRDAGKTAGLNVLALLKAPQAAALAHGWAVVKNKKIAVLDLGGGTHESSILEGGAGVWELKVSLSDAGLGGETFNRIIAGWLAEEFKVQSGIDVQADAARMIRLAETAEQAKCELSFAGRTEICLPFFAADAFGPRHFSRILTRAKLDQLTGFLVERSMDIFFQTLRQGDCALKDLQAVIVTGGQSRMPLVRRRAEERLGLKPRWDERPEETAARGAALMAASVQKYPRRILGSGFTPLALGLETRGGVMSRMIARNTPIPVRKSRIFSTSADNQTTVSIHVLQGEREMAADNRTVGRFDLTGIPAAPQGVPQIEVGLDIDLHGITRVFARDLVTGREQKITITAASGLSSAEVEQMVGDAQAHCLDDSRLRERAETANRGAMLAYNTEKILSEHGEKADEVSREQLRKAAGALRQALAGGEDSAIREACGHVEKLAKKFSEAVYARIAVGHARESKPVFGGFRN